MALNNAANVLVFLILYGFVVFVIVKNLVKLTNIEDEIENIKLLGQFNQLENELIEIEIATQAPSPPTSELLKIFQCNDRQLVKSVRQKGDFTVFYNYVQAERTFKCEESITYTTPADFRFLDNVVSVATKWKGPVSVALYAPGTDFKITLEIIAYLRQCETRLIRELVTFHLFFETKHTPRGFALPLINAYEDSFDCKLGSPFLTLPNDSDLYKSKNSLLFPINVARNIAREAVQTHLVFPSDIELYPTPHFIQNFFAMIRKQPHLITDGKNVFVLPVFEVTENCTVPKNKTELQKMFDEEEAVWFHVQVCDICHIIPEAQRWISEDETKGLDIFTSTKRQGEYRVWEPFYVCANEEPLFDERVTWEGQSNKMTQAYIMCLLDYNFLVLNNAFLVHKPGIKKKKVQNEQFRNIVNLTNEFVRSIFVEEMTLLYGEQKNCTMVYLKDKNQKTYTTNAIFS